MSFKRKIKKFLKSASPVLGGSKGLKNIVKSVSPVAASGSIRKRIKNIMGGQNTATAGEANASAPAAAPEDNRSGMAGTAMLKRGGAVRKDMMGRAMKKTGADAMGRAMAKKPAAKKPAAKKMMGGGMMKGYKSGGMAKKSGRGC